MKIHLLCEFKQEKCHPASETETFVSAYYFFLFTVLTCNKIKATTST